MEALVIRIVKFKDRFGDPTDAGWADIMVLLMFRTGPKVVFELQLTHFSLMVVRRDLGAHSEYSEFRASGEILGRMDPQGLSMLSMASSASYSSKVVTSPPSSPRQSFDCAPLLLGHRRGGSDCSVIEL